MTVQPVGSETLIQPEASPQANPLVDVVKRALNLTAKDIFLSDSAKNHRLRADIASVLELKRKQQLDLEREIAVCESLSRNIDRIGGLDASLMISFLSRIDTTDILSLVIRNRDQNHTPFPSSAADLKEILRLCPHAKSLIFERVVDDKDLDLVKGMERVDFVHAVNASKEGLSRFRENNPTLKWITFKDECENMHLAIPSSVEVIIVERISSLTQDFWTRVLHLPKLLKVVTNTPPLSTYKIHANEQCLENLNLILSNCFIAEFIEVELNHPNLKTAYEHLREKYPHKNFLLRTS